MHVSIDKGIYHFFSLNCGPFTVFGDAIHLSFFYFRNFNNITEVSDDYNQPQIKQIKQM